MKSPATRVAIALRGKTSVGVRGTADDAAARGGLYTLMTLRAFWEGVQMPEREESVTSIRRGEGEGAEATTRPLATVEST